MEAGKHAVMERVQRNVDQSSNSIMTMYDSLRHHEKKRSSTCVADSEIETDRHIRQVLRRSTRNKKKTPAGARFATFANTFGNLPPVQRNSTSVNI